MQTTIKPDFRTTISPFLQTHNPLQLYQQRNPQSVPINMRMMLKPLALSALLCSPALAWSPHFFNVDLLPRGATNTSVAECGKDAPPGNQSCPLNICCSEFGHCGTTSDFCGKGCQNGCEQPKKPTCDKASAAHRTVGYYESWARSRHCQEVKPEGLNVTGFTHINYGFASFDPNTFAIGPANGTETEVYKNFTDLKTTNRGLQTWIAIGGWDFNDPGATANAFSNMVGSAENRTKFIKEITGFMQTYAFDGVDIDWEYPSADDRGGRPADKENFLAFAKEFRVAVDATAHGFSVTLPASYWYLKDFDVAGMADYVDFYNLMSYDMHGVWDKDIKGAGPYIAPHTNLTEIDKVLDLLLKAKLAPEKVNLGLAFYGRTFTLKDDGCTDPNGVCEFSDAGQTGSCSATKGILSLEEIQEILSKNLKLSPKLDKEAAVKYMTYNKSQWIGYDDEETIGLKRSHANDRCLGGTMVWAMDQIDQKTSCGLPVAERADHRLPPYNASGIVATDCKQIQVPDNSDCSATAKANNVTCAQIIAWNSQIPNDWKKLKAAQPICVSPPGGWYKLAPPLPKPSTTDTGSVSSTAAASGSVVASTSGSAVASASESAVATASGSATGSASGSGTTQPGSPSNCKSFATPTPGDDCNKIASANGIELSQLYTLNPALGPSCAALQAGVGYCIATGSSDGSATVAPSANATATAGASASASGSSSVISESASVGTDASSSGIPTASYAPSSVIGTLTATPSASASASLASQSGAASIEAPSSEVPTITNASLLAALTAIPAKPTKTQTGLAANCAKFAQVTVKGESCDAFAKESSITPEQLYAWNPVLGPNGADCTNNLWMEGWNYCVGTASGATGSGSPSTPASSTASTAAASGTIKARDVYSSVTGTPNPLSCTATVIAATAKPSATQVGIAADCIKFVQAGKDDWCDAFAVKNGIRPTELYAWNQILGWNGSLCNNFRPGMYYCVCATSGGVPDSIFPQTEKAPHRWTLLGSGPASSEAGTPSSAAAAGASATIA